VLYWKSILCSVDHWVFSDDLATNWPQAAWRFQWHDALALAYQALAKLPASSTSGMDGLGPTYLKPITESGAVTVASIYVRLLHTPAADWPSVDARLTLVGKSATDTSCQSWMPLTVLPVLWRLMITVNYLRVRSYLTHNVPAYAFGYSPGVGATDLLAALLTILRRRAEFRLPVALL
jgi:hypothetical protein